MWGGSYLFSCEDVLCGGVYFSLSGTLSMTDTCSFKSVETELFQHAIKKLYLKSRCGEVGESRSSSIAMDNFV